MPTVSGNITQVTLPDGTLWDIADATARAALIDKLEKVVTYPLPPKTSIDPSTMNNKIYLIPRNGDLSAPDVYDAYIIALESGTGYDDPNATFMWVHIGSTEIDLSGFSLKGHTHQVTPQTRVADHDFTVTGTLPSLEFTGTPSTVTGSVTLTSGDVTIQISDSSGDTSYTPGGTISGNTSIGGSHAHTVRKEVQYLELDEKTFVRGTSSETVMAHASNYTDTTHYNVLKLTSNNVTPVQHTIQGLKSASLTGALTTGTNIAADGELEELASGNNSNAVFNSASVSSGVLSFGLKQIKKNVSAVTGIGTLGTDAVALNSSNNDTFSVYESNQMNTATIKNWDLTEVQLTIPNAEDNPTKFATGRLVTTADGDPIISNILGPNDTGTGTITNVDTSSNGSHSHSGGTLDFDGYEVFFDASLDNGGSGTITSGSCTPSGSVSYTGGSSWTSDRTFLPHTVYNPTVFTSPDDNEGNHSNDWYGITWNEDTDADPDKSFGRIGNMTFHQTLPVQSKMVRCVLNNDGTVNYYLDPTDSTKKYNGTYNGITSDGSNADLSGTDGNVMVEIPEHWYYVTKDQNNNITAMVSPTSQVGWVHMPKYYVSAYESCGSTSRMTSVSGANPIKTNGLSTTRSAARANGTSGEYKWNMYPYFVHVDLYWLYVIEYANTNCQAAVNNELLDGKYRQGGLGNGCTSTSLTLSSNAPANLTGTTNSLGNASGEVTVDNNGTNVKIASYRGIENFFGHIAKQVDGLLINVTGDSSSYSAEAFICTDPSKFSSSSTTNYTSLGWMSSSSSYIKKVKIGDSGRGWTLSTYSTGASNTSFYCDGNRFSFSSDSIKMAFVGGCCGNVAHVYGSSAGIAALCFSYSYSTTDLGATTSRLVWYDKSQE